MYKLFFILRRPTWKQKKKKTDIFVFCGNELPHIIKMGTIIINYSDQCQLFLDNGN